MLADRRHVQAYSSRIFPGKFSVISGRADRQRLLAPWRFGVSSDMTAGWLGLFTFADLYR
jgi:hypothetical protein